MNSAEHNKELELDSIADDTGFCASRCAHIFPESINAKISDVADKVYFFPTDLDVFLFILSSPRYRLIMRQVCGLSWSVLDIIRLLKS